MLTKIFSAGVTAIFILCGTASPALAVVIPGLPESGSPHVIFDDTRVTVASMNSGGWSLTATAKGDFTLSPLNGMPGDPYLGRGRFSLKAQFDPLGSLLPGGVIEIYGKVDGLGGSKKELLFSAGLGGFGSATDMLGFLTTNIYCSPLIQVQDFVCTPEESVYFLLGADQEWLGFDQLTRKRSRFDTQSLTTLPAPAALPLALTAFGLLIPRLRRRRGAESAQRA